MIPPPYHRGEVDATASSPAWWQALSGVADPALLYVAWLFLTPAGFDTDPVWNLLITLVPCVWERPSNV